MTDTLPLLLLDAFKRHSGTVMRVPRDGAFAETELDGFVQRRDASLQQVTDLGDFLGTDLREQIRQQRGQLLATGGLFQRLEGRSERSEGEHR